MENCLNASDNRQYGPDSQSEAMKRRERVEHAVGFGRQTNQRTDLLNIGNDVLVRQRHAFWLALST